MLVLHLTTDLWTVMEDVKSFEAIVVGSGLAGGVTALELAERGLRVALITKRSLEDGASPRAQGGIAAALSSLDSIDTHMQDTLIAGAGLCDTEATHFILERGKMAIQWLIQRGVCFTQENGTLHLTREGGHSQRRIAHVADATGAAIQNTLHPQLRAHPRIHVFEHHMLVDLITSERLDLPGPRRCVGLYALEENSGEVLAFTAPHTLLATGGAGKVYLYTTNPDTATGDGIAAGWRAGCTVANMEFIQFHPTCLYHPHAKSFLISEAVRGEGGILRLPNGHRFMPEHDARAELAPRDIVARTIDYEMKRHGLDCVYLDITHLSPEFIRGHFPTIHEKCLSLGIDMTTQPIPVVPAAHYTCGGLRTDLQGRTDLAGLYAVGETAYTGLHGANRLASNSLLECVVMAREASAAILSSPPPVPSPVIPPWDSSQVTDPDEEVVISHNWEELRRFMWDYVGIVRTDKRLERATHRLKLLHEEILEFYTNFHVSRDLLELRNLVTVSQLIVDSARLRKESRGLHYSRDYPLSSASSRPTLLTPP
ncbi:L-aspartate oxidase [Ferrovum sp.]|uniref:L-aspartate oxidase n=1 Tax=Ferrovum sp. TaxID=2609467 RepID=UPI00263578C3|nr:L-aspartate oxidase [Ferrovum sp.]